MAFQAVWAPWPHAATTGLFLLVALNQAANSIVVRRPPPCPQRGRRFYAAHLERQKADIEAQVEAWWRLGGDSYALLCFACSVDVTDPLQPSLP